MLHISGYLILALLAVLIYWVIGVGVSFLDIRIRTWMLNHPMWRMNPPTNIKASKVTAMWVLYVPSVVILGIGWLFTKGTPVVHRFINTKLNKG